MYLSEELTIKNSKANSKKKEENNKEEKLMKQKTNIQKTE